MKVSLFLISLTFNLLILPAASATSMLPITLEQLSTRASLIFYARVTSNEVIRDDESGHIATFTEFEIIDLIKGSCRRDTHDQTDWWTPQRQQYPAPDPGRTRVSDRQTIRGLFTGKVFSRFQQPARPAPGQLFRNDH